MTNLYGLVAEKTEPNLIEGNIKSSVTIFGVTGNYEGEMPVTSVAGYIINETPHDIENGHDYPTTFFCNANFEYNGYVFAISLKYYETLWKMNLSTKTITWIGESGGSALQAYEHNSIYKDGDYIYFNCTNNGHIPPLPYNYKYNYVTNIWDFTLVAGHHTTGTLLSGYTTISGLKYTGFDIMTNGSGNPNPNQHNFGFKIYS